eukprot:CAMPEP_0171764220 /NCGR_PEP_ID=MMETSP0991-20121206/49845_1 /TAXON_ID=483369 /ORGANISM="non described non described, Strain CCMP2098" /LENGTH=388 /DNA_ID=CAMNT_0012368279 /DNA_START=92 /DNA_END=1258 /DNA_ORIENTATION=+
MGGASSTVHCPNGFDAEGNIIREADGKAKCPHCEKLSQVAKLRCSCMRCVSLREHALPDKVDDFVCSAYLFGAERKVAGRVFNQFAWDASKGESGFISRSQLLDPRALDKATALGQVLRFGSAELADAPPDLFADREFMERAIEIDPDSLAFVAPELVHSDKAFMHVALEKDGEVLGKASEALRNSKETALIAVEQNGHALKFASEALRNDRDVVLRALRSGGGCGAALKHASESLRADKACVLEAVRSDKDMLKHASEELRSDREVVAAALLHDGPSPLRDAGLQARSDRPTVLLAVRRSGSALEFASKKLRDDKEVVLLSLNDSGACLRFASRRLRDDDEVCQQARKRDPWAGIYASKRIREEFKRRASGETGDAAPENSPNPKEF